MATKKPASGSAKPASTARSRRKPAAAKAEPVVLDPPKGAASKAAKASEIVDAKAVDVTPEADLKPANVKVEDAPASAPEGPAAAQADTRKNEPVADAKPNPEPAAKTSSPVAGIGAMVAGGALAALIGYLAHDTISPPPVLPDYAPEIARLEAATRQAAEAGASEIAALDARIAELEAARAASPVARAEEDVAALKAELEAKAANLAARLDASEARLGALLADLEASRSRISATLGTTGEEIGTEATALLQTYGAEIETLKAQIAAQVKDSAALSERLDQVAAAAGEKLDLARETIGELSDKATEAARNVDLSLARERLKMAVETGKSYAAILSEVAGSAATEIPEALLKSANEGVTTLPELQASFPAAARDALKASIRADAGDGTGSRVFAFLKSQLGARSLEERAGDDPDAILSQAEAALGRGELAASVELVKRLPAAGLVEMAGWLARAEARLAVEAALAEFAGPEASQ